MKQRTLGLVKPNATAAELQDFILNDVNNSDYGLKVVKSEMLTLTEEQAKEFYAEHAEKSFFGELVEFMTSGPIVAFVVEGDNAVQDYRTLLGNTDPAKAEAWTIRGKYASKKEENSAHGSDSIEAAEREVNFFFG
ncbi:nucleoside-diphosphate kinase [Vibrio owensii]|uniref:nucleoside-diphosphate kinase n=1 Tax=Vibrio owensii TaxID=696485 RepID=UPI003CC56C12